MSDANEDTTEIERHNVFEDITLADSSYFFTVSTVGDLVTAKRINLTSRSYSIGGQIADDSLQIATGGLGAGRDSRQEESEKELDTSVGFQSRYGRGVQLASTTHTRVSSSPE